jgi:hypothetical protein
MNLRRMDADTAERSPGSSRVLRRAAEFVWPAVDFDGAGSPRQQEGR